MKRLTILFFLFIYLAASIGFVLNYHYCGGELTAVSISLSNKGNCTCEEENSNENTDKDCCKSDSRILKNTEVHKPASYCTNNIKVTSKIYDYTNCNLSLSNWKYHFIHNKIQKPPLIPISQVPIYLVNRAFII